MRTLVLASVAASLALLSGGTRTHAADCAPLGNIQWICNLVSPEDFAVAPRSDWMIASGNKAGQGAVRAVNVRTRTVTNLYPSSQAVRSRPDAVAYPTCPGPLNASDPVEQAKFAAHGMFLKHGSMSIYTFFVVHHGSRESVEVFELDGGAASPALTWTGCFVAPENGVFNAVAGLYHTLTSAFDQSKPANGGGRVARPEAHDARSIEAVGRTFADPQRATWVPRSPGNGRPLHGRTRA